MILDGKRSRKNEETLKSDLYEIKICAYCDQRVALDGVVGIIKNLKEYDIYIRKLGEVNYGIHRYIWWKQ